MPYPHNPRRIILIWIAFTFPFTIWDTLYIILRPHSLPGHKWHSPIWVPVASYAAVDGIYSERAWVESEGWTAAQGAINVTEVCMYIWYFWVIQTKARNGSKYLDGRADGKACVLGLIAGTITWTKSSLYVLRECFSGFKYVGHADWMALLSTWGFMNALYISASSYMIYVFATDIVDGFALLGRGLDSKNI